MSKNAKFDLGKLKTKWQAFVWFLHYHFGKIVILLIIGVVAFSATRLTITKDKIVLEKEAADVDIIGQVKK
jgi:hypothetical protein